MTPQQTKTETTRKMENNKQTGALWSWKSQHGRFRVAITLTLWDGFDIGGYSFSAFIKACLSLRSSSSVFRFSNWFSNNLVVAEFPLL